MRANGPEHRVLYADDLDARGCSVPGCTHSSDDDMVLTSRCCVGRPTVAAYRAGVLTLTCAQCRRHVVSLAVASRRDVAPPPRG